MVRDIHWEPLSLFQAPQHEGQVRAGWGRSSVPSPAPPRWVLSHPCGSAHGSWLCTKPGVLLMDKGTVLSPLPSHLPHSLRTLRFPSSPSSLPPHLPHSAEGLGFTPSSFSCPFTAGFFFSQQKMPERRCLSRLWMQAGGGRRRPVPRPRRALAPCCSFIHSLIPPLIHSCLGSVRPSRDGSLSPGSDSLPCPSSPPGISAGSSAPGPPCAGFLPGAQPGAP